MNAKPLTLLISAACTVAGLLSGLAPARTETATAVPQPAEATAMARTPTGFPARPGPTAQA